MTYRSTTSTENVEAVAFLVNKYEKEIASLCEQLSNMMHLVASVEKERDEALKDIERWQMGENEQLTAMTKEEVQRTKQWSYELKRADALVVELAACETARDEKEVALKGAVALYQALQDQLAPTAALNNEECQPVDCDCIGFHTGACRINKGESK